MSQDDGSSIIVIDDNLDASSAADIDVDSDSDSAAAPTARKATVKAEKMAAAPTLAVVPKPVPKLTVSAAPKRKRDAMVDTLKDIVGQDHQSKLELLQLSHKAKRQRTEMELKHKAVEAEKARAHELQTLKLRIQLAQINSGAQMPSMRTMGSSKHPIAFHTGDSAPYGAGSSSGCATPYSTSNASGFDGGEGSSLSHNSSNDVDLSFHMYDTIDTAFPPLPSTYQSTYNTQSDASHKLPPSSSSAI
jgi:hypothetical protein